MLLTPSQISAYKLVLSTRSKLPLDLENDLELELDRSRRSKRIHARAEPQTQEVSGCAVFKRAGRPVWRTQLPI